MSKPAWIICLILQTYSVTNVIASTGDRSQIYNQCLMKYRINHCKDGTYSKYCELFYGYNSFDL